MEKRTVIAECERGLKELNEWEEELTSRFRKGEVAPLDALRELTEIKLSRFQILACARA